MFEVGAVGERLTRSRFDDVDEVFLDALLATVGSGSIKIETGMPTWKTPNHAIPTWPSNSRCCSLLATLWGASYTFIKLGVATIPPITLIAARTLIAGLLLLVIMRWRGLRLPTDAATWRRFLFQACLNSVIPWTLIAWGERSLDAGLATILNSDVADLHVLPDARHHPARGARACENCSASSPEWPASA